MRKINKVLLISSLSISIIIIVPPIAQGSTQPGEKAGQEISLENSDGEVIQELPVIIEGVQSIWQKIRLGKLADAIQDILGLIELINSTKEATVTSDEDSSYDDPETPEEVYRQEKNVESNRAQIPQNLLGIVFSPQGQERLKNQQEQIVGIQQAVTEAQQEIYKESQLLADMAEIGVRDAGEIKVIGDKAQSEKASQDVLKALAAQNKYLSGIMAGNSEQLASLGQIEAYQSAQLNGINSQLGILNDKTEVLEVLIASQNHQMAQINAHSKEQKNYQHYKDSLEKGLNQKLSRMPFIPGLYPVEEE